jgi:hypothetical protein
MCFLIFWVFGIIDPKKGLYLISWEEELKVERCCRWKNIGYMDYPLDARPNVLRAMKCFSKKFKDL